MKWKMGLATTLLAGLGAVARAGMVYKVDFEAGEKKAVVGTAMLEEWEGGTITVVDNPNKSLRNASAKAAKCLVGGRRAEFSSQRMSVEGKTYVYKWSYLIPTAYRAEGLLSQWKTYPCGKHDGYAQEICYSCGIFNDIRMADGGSQFHFAWRAQPSCQQVLLPSNRGEWVEFQQEIKWTTGFDGYFKLWMNGNIVKEASNIKTLMDRFQPGKCNMYWAVGIYATQSDVPVYIDNMEIWDTSGVQGILGAPGTTVLRIKKPAQVFIGGRYEPMNTTCKCTWCTDGDDNVLDIKGAAQTVPPTGTGIPAFQGEAAARLPKKVYIVRKRQPADSSHPSDGRQPSTR